MNIALTDDLQGLLRKKVEDGQFPTEEAVVEAALRHFLIVEPAQGAPPPSTAAEPRQDPSEEARPWRGVYGRPVPSA
jgi:hypothetical protein